MVRIRSSVFLIGKRFLMCDNFLICTHAGFNKFHSPDAFRLHTKLIIREYCSMNKPSKLNITTKFDLKK